MFVTFEGIEGSGKSTMLDRLCGRLQAAGQPFIRTREPGGSELGHTLRGMLLDTRGNIVPAAELFLYLADRAQHVDQVIRPALARRHAVLSDRYADSTIAYQGYGRGLSLDALAAMHDLATGGLWPDLTLLFDLPPQTGLERARARDARAGVSLSEGRFEAEHIDFHQRVREGYLERASLYPERFRIIDAATDEAAVFEQVCRILRPLFAASPVKTPQEACGSDHS